MTFCWRRVRLIALFLYLYIAICAAILEDRSVSQARADREAMRNGNDVQLYSPTRNIGRHMRRTKESGSHERRKGHWSSHNHSKRRVKVDDEILKNAKKMKMERFVMMKQTFTSTPRLGDLCLYQVVMGEYSPSGLVPPKKTVLPEECCIECMMLQGCAFSLFDPRGECHLYDFMPTLIGESSTPFLLCGVVLALNPFNMGSVYSWPRTEEMGNLRQDYIGDKALIAVSTHQGPWPAQFFWGPRKRHPEFESAPVAEWFRDMYMRNGSILSSRLHNSLSLSSSLPPERSSSLDFPKADVTTLFRPLRDKNEKVEDFWRRHFDKRYVITLKERKEHAMETLNGRWGIDAEVVKACTPADVQQILKQSEIATLMAICSEKDSNYLNVDQTLKLLGTSYSHIWALERCKKDKGKACLIMEDDLAAPSSCTSGQVGCSYDPMQRSLAESSLLATLDVIESAFADLPPTWEVLFLGYCDEDCNRLKMMGPHLGVAETAYCYHAYAISQRGIDKMLYKMKLVKHFRPIDWAHRIFNFYTPGYDWTLDLLEVVELARIEKNITKLLVESKARKNMKEMESKRNQLLRTRRERELMEAFMLRSLEYTHEEGMETLVSEDYTTTMPIESYVVVPAVLFQNRTVMSTVGRTADAQFCKQSVPVIAQ